MRWRTRGAIGGLLLLALFACGTFGSDDQPPTLTDAGPSDEGGPTSDASDGGADGQVDGGARLYVFGGGSSPTSGSTLVYSAPVLATGLGGFTTEPARLNSARVYASSTSVDGMLVSLGGKHSDGSLSDELETLAPGATAWSKRSVGFYGAFYAIAAGNHRVFLAGGLTGSNPYDTGLRIGDFTGGTVPMWSTDPLAFGEGRQRAAGAFQGNVLYVTGGAFQPGDGGTNSMSKVNVGRLSGSTLDGGTLAPVSPLLKGRQNHQLVVVAQYLFAIGGFDGNNNPLLGVEVAALSADGSPGQWAAATDMPQAVGDFCAVATADAVFVVGGFTKPEGLSPTAVADVRVGRFVSGDLIWDATTPLPVPLGGVGCAIR